MNTGNDCKKKRGVYVDEAVEAVVAAEEFGAVGQRVVEEEEDILLRRLVLVRYLLQLALFPS